MTICEPKCLGGLYLDEVFERGPLDVVELGRQDDARPGAGLSAHQVVAARR